MELGGISFWYRDLGGLPAPRPPLGGDQRCDVCIIGAGFTGLWTAYYLKKAAPHLDIVLLEQRFAGFGASGRNGGWLTGGFAWSPERYAAQSGAAGVLAMAGALHASVAEVARVTKTEAIACDLHETDELMVATNPAQWARARTEVAARQHWGEAARVRLLDRAEAEARVKIPGLLGAMCLSGVARVQPAKLVQGLAARVAALGAEIAEGTKVLRYGPGFAETDHGRVTARFVLRATEGFTTRLQGHARDWLPLNSAQIVTPVLPPEVWAEIGWQGAEILGDFANSYAYCQRTASGRIALGGRGTAYRFASRIDEDGLPDAGTLALLKKRLARLFPAALPYGLDHAWCGVLGVPRDWCATLGFDRETGLGHAGGYVGVGLTTSNLAGRTLADLVLGRESPLTTLPWVNRPVRRWEIEPFRYLGVRGLYALLRAADRAEARPGARRPSRLATLGHWIAGR